MSRFLRVFAETVGMLLFACVGAVILFGPMALAIWASYAFDLDNVVALPLVLLATFLAISLTMAIMDKALR